MKIQSVCVLGGTGFVGGYIVRRLAREICRVRVLTRRRERHKDLLVIPNVSLIEARVQDGDALARNFSDCDAVINLVGILNESRGGSNGFQTAHVELPHKVVAACREHGVGRLLHMSALNANAGEAHSRYLRTKGEGEDLVHGAGDAQLAVTSFRPSVIFGEGDSFFNRFATLLKWSPVVFPLACHGARFAPVYVGDVADAFLRALNDKATVGRRLDLCGPESFTLWELVEYTAKTARLNRSIVGLGDTMSRWQARILGLVPGRPFTMDNYYSLQHDSVCANSPWEELEISPKTIQSVVPGYLSPQGRVRGRYAEWRRHAGRGG